VSRRLHDVFQICLGVTAAISVSALIPNQLWGQTNSIAVKAARVTNTVTQVGHKPQTLNEWELKTLFVIADSTEWPTGTFTNDTSPFIFGILGKDPFGEEIKFIKDSEVKKRKLEVRHFSSAQQAKDKGCHLLFIGSSEEDRLSDIFKALENTAILTTGDRMDRFIERNGMLNLLPREGEMRWEINDTAAKKARLTIGFYFRKKARTVL